MAQAPPVRHHQLPPRHPRAYRLPLPEPGRLHGAADRSIEDLYHAASVLRSEHDPLNTDFESNLATSAFSKRIADSHETLSAQEVDAGFATFAEPANFSALSPVQIDTFEHAIQSALADDDALLTYCYNIKRNLSRNPQQ